MILHNNYFIGTLYSNNLLIIFQMYGIVMFTDNIKLTNKENAAKEICFLQ